MRELNEETEMPLKKPAKKLKKGKKLESTKPLTKFGGASANFLKIDDANSD